MKRDFIAEIVCRNCCLIGEAMNCPLQRIPTAYGPWTQGQTPALTRVSSDHTHGMCARASSFLGGSQRPSTGCHYDVGNQFRVYHGRSHWISCGAFDSREARFAIDGHVVGRVQVARCAQVVVPDGAPDSSPSDRLTRWCIFSISGRGAIIVQTIGLWLIT